MFLVTFSEKIVQDINNFGVQTIIFDGFS